MDNSVIIAVINDTCRLARGLYEDGHKEHVFKTLDQCIAVDDLVVVESGTRHNMTVVKITEIDIDVNLDSEKGVKWIVQKVDKEPFEELLKQEAQAIAAVQRSERNHQKEELRKKMFFGDDDAIKNLSLSHIEGTSEKVIEPPKAPPAMTRENVYNRDPYGG